MIGKLSGKLDSVHNGQAIIDVGGVGYVVACSAATIRSMGAVGNPVSLLIETQVREDAINLYGFADSLERDWFRLLNGVQGVGAKSALAVLSVLPPDTLARAIAAQDKATVTRADGVGPKLALRIVTELKDKAAVMIGHTGVSISVNSGGVAPCPHATGNNSQTAIGDAVSALANLGYSRMDAFTAVTNAASRLELDVGVEILIREGLAEMGKR